MKSDREIKRQKRAEREKKEPEKLLGLKPEQQQSRHCDELETVAENAGTIKKPP